MTSLPLDFPASQLVVILSEPAGCGIAARWIAEKFGWRHEMLTAPLPGGRHERRLPL